MNLLFGKNLRFLRKEKGLNQAEIAEIVEKGDGTISNWEKGLAEPSFSEIGEISKYFGISMSDILFVDLSNASLINEKEDGKNHAKASRKASRSASLITGNRANEPFIEYSNPKNSATLIETLKELVESKNQIITDLKDKNSRLEGTIKELEKKIEKSKHSGLA